MTLGLKLRRNKAGKLMFGRGNEIPEVTDIGWVLWHINLCRLFNAKYIFYVNNQFYVKQFSLARVQSLIVKNISISNYSVYCKYSFNVKNCSISNNS